MRRIQSTAIGVLLLTLAGACTEQAESVSVQPPAGSSPAGLPRIHVPHPSRALGEVPLGPQEIAVDVYNRGQTDLLLVRIETSCACTDAVLEASTVPPGEKTTLRVRISLKQPEERAARVTIHSNDPDRRKTDVTLQWRAVGPFTMDPEIIDFGIVRPNESAARELRLIHDPAPSGSLQCRRSESPECRPASLLTAQKINDEVADDTFVERWEIVLKPTGEYPTQQGSVTFHFEDCGSSKTVVPVAWRTRQPIEASPSRLFLGSGMAGRRVSASAVLSSDEGSQLEVSSIHWQGDILKLKVTHCQETTSTVEIRVEGEVPNQPGLLKDELVVQCAGPFHHELRIPVTTFVTSESDPK